MKKKSYFLHEIDFNKNVGKEFRVVCEYKGLQEWQEEFEASSKARRREIRDIKELQQHESRFKGRAKRQR